MQFKKQFHQPWFGGGVGAALAILCGLSVLLFSFGKQFCDWSFDLPFCFRGENTVKDVIVVYLDERSYAELGQDPSKFDRALHAKLLRRLKAEGAKLVVFDVLFLDPQRPVMEAEHDFAKAMREFGPVVLGAQFHHDQMTGSMVWPPIDVLRDAAAGWGMAQIHRDADFAARIHHPGTEQVPCIAWKAAELAGAEVTRRPENRRQERWMNYYCPEPFASASYCDVVLGKKLPANFSFRDKYVFIGSGEVAGFTGEEKEQVRYPWTWLSGHFPFGVEMHALTFANLLHQDWLRRTSITIEVLIIIFFGGLLGYGLSLFRPMAAAGISLATALAILAFAVFASSVMRFWFPWMIVVAVQIPLALGWSFLFHSIRTYVETKLLMSSLELYLSPKQVKQILKQPDLLKPGATQKTVSILFSDIAGFSKISERLDASDLVKLLNDYYETAIGCIHETDGTVMNLIGDAIFAIWNAPQEQADHQIRACRAALLLNQRLIEFDAKSNQPPLRTRVGLHTGVVCVGNIGSTTHFDYTAIGESVNMASRLEGLNKHLGTNILATREAQKAIEGELISRLVGHFKFKGFDQVVEVHEMVALPEGEETTRVWRQAFANAMNRLQRKAFDEAEQEFKKTLALKKDDGPSLFYLSRIPELRNKSLPSDWFGEIDLAEK